MASKGWDQNSNSQTWPINRGWSNSAMYTKIVIELVFIPFSLLLQFLLQIQAIIEFWEKEWFNPNQCFKHSLNIIWKLFEPSIHHKNTQNSESPRNLHYCTYWASNIKLSIHSCVFNSNHSQSFYNSYRTHLNPKIRTDIVPFIPPHSKTRGLQLDLEGKIQWVSVQSKGWNTLSEVQGSYLDHHFAPGSPHTSFEFSTQEVSFQICDIFIQAYLA